MQGGCRGSSASATTSAVPTTDAAIKRLYTYSRRRWSPRGRRRPSGKSDGSATSTTSSSRTNARSERKERLEWVGRRRRSLCWLPPREARTVYRYGVLRQIVGAGFLGFVIILGYGAIVSVIWYGARLVISGDLSAGDLIAFIMFAVRIGASIGMLAGLVASVYNALGAAARTWEIVDREPRVPLVIPLDEDPPPHTGRTQSTTPSATSIGDTSTGVELQTVGVGEIIIPTKDEPNIRGEITFDNVSFRYPSRAQILVLKRLSLHIPINATVAFVGPSGGGKSTLMSLIQRFYDTSEGRVLLDGQDVRDFSHRQIRDGLSWVQQEPVLFGLTVRENLVYGLAARRGDSSLCDEDERTMVAAAQAAFAHEFVDALPEKYDTLVGERGVRLSGGQKQRIAIARALLINPRILLLDEATSALDAESEHLVQLAIEKLMHQRTTVIVAHRLSTVQHADRIFLIDKKRVRASGTHDELMRDSRPYRDLVQRQLQQKK